MQEQLMKYSPDTGEECPYPSNAEHYRDNEWHTKKGTSFHKDGIYRVAPITTY